MIRLADADAATATCAAGSMTIAASSPGDWANTLGIVTRKDPDDPTRFRLDVTDADDVVIESFAGLSMTAGDARYAPAIINDHSRLIKVAINGAEIPADGTVPLNGLTAGHVGTLLAPDAAGAPGITYRTDLLAAFDAGGPADRIDLFNIICVPGLVDAPTVARLQACARDRRAFLLVDCAETATAADISASLTGMTGDNASYAALYFPWVRAPDPLQGGTVRPFPPCGFVAGIIARADASRGVWKAPAGIEAMWSVPPGRRSS